MPHFENLEERAKIIDRIKSLLAMSSDISSPNEAAIALKRARKLMDKYQVSFLDIENVLADDFGESDFNSGFKSNRLWLGMLVISVAKLNDCVCLGSRTHRSANISYTFKGFKGDTEVCNFMITYLMQTAERFYKIDRDNLQKIKQNKNTYKLNKNTYMLSFANSISSMIEDILAEREAQKSKSDSRSLVLVKMAKVEHEFGATKTKTRTSIIRDDLSKNLGMAAAKKVHLGRFIEDNV